MSQTLSPGAVAPASGRPLWLIGGAVAAVALTVGGAFALRGGGTPAPVATPVAESLAKGEALVAAPATPAPAVAEAVPASPVAKPTVPARPAPQTKPAPAAKVATPDAARPATPAAPVAAERVVQAPACVDCGVIESVRSVSRKGEGSGVGAVAGGVLGAVLGNQVGKGSGRTAATVLGAVGGGVAGHEIEKRSKSSTVFVVGVRMDDGSLRSVEQSQAPKVGERVQIEGKVLKPLPAARS